MNKIYQKKTLREKTGVRRHFGGFTLIELLVVVLIIGILAAVALPNYQKAVARSRLSNAITLASSIAQAEQLYLMANGEYTLDASNLDITLPAECEKRNETAEVTLYSCGSFYFQLYQEGPNGFGRVLVRDLSIPSWILWGFDPKHYRYCGVVKTDENVEFGKSICKTYGELTASNSGYWYYSLY